MLSPSLANHYISLLNPSKLPEPEELGRFPELVHTLAGLRSDFWQNATYRLSELLSRLPGPTVPSPSGLNAMVAIAQTVARFEEFEVVEAIGTAIQRVASTIPVSTRSAVFPAPRNLISVHVVERVLELFLQKKRRSRMDADCLGIC